VADESGRGDAPRPGPVAHRRRTPSRRERFVSRFDRLDSLDHVTIGTYLGFIVWGAVAQFEQPSTLTGGSGVVLARLVTIAILVTAVLALIGLVIDKTDRCGRQRTELELPALIGLIGAWSTYAVVVWLLVCGAAGPDFKPTLKVFGVLTTMMLVPLVVRLVVLIADGIRTIKAARMAVELGIVDENGHPKK
jgi:hypothetical protein